MLNSSCINNVNELFDAGIHTRTNVCIVQKCTLFNLLHFYFYLRCTGFQCSSLKLFLYFFFFTIRTLGGFIFNEMRKLHSYAQLAHKYTHSHSHVFEFYITNRNECICIHLLGFAFAVQIQCAVQGLTHYTLLL